MTGVLMRRSPQEDRHIETTPVDDVGRDTGDISASQGLPGFNQKSGGGKEGLCPELLRRLNLVGLLSSVFQSQSDERMSFHSSFVITAAFREEQRNGLSLKSNFSSLFLDSLMSLDCETHRLPIQWLSSSFYSLGVSVQAGQGCQNYQSQTRWPLVILVVEHLRSRWKKFFFFFSLFFNLLRDCSLFVCSPLSGGLSHNFSLREVQSVWTRSTLPHILLTSLVVLSENIVTPLSSEIELEYPHMNWNTIQVLVSPTRLNSLLEHPALSMLLDASRA